MDQRSSLDSGLLPGDTPVEMKRSVNCRDRYLQSNQRRKLTFGDVLWGSTICEWATALHISNDKHRNDRKVNMMIGTERNYCLSQRRFENVMGEKYIVGIAVCSCVLCQDFFTAERGLQNTLEQGAKDLL